MLNIVCVGVGVGAWVGGWVRACVRVCVCARARAPRDEIESCSNCEVQLEFLHHLCACMCVCVCVCCY